MPDFVRVAKIEDIPHGDGLVVKVHGREIGLFTVAGEVHAIDNICPHRQGPLAEGILEDGVISCPWHAWTFDIRTGKCTFNESVAVEKFPVRVVEGAVEVLVAGSMDKV